MAAKYEIEKFNGSNFSLWKLKMRAILRKDNCLAAIEDRPTGITDDRWKEMDDNAIANLHLAMADTVLSSVAERRQQKKFGTRSPDSLEYHIAENECTELLLQSLPDSYDQLIINLTNNILTDYLVFNDVAATVLEEESRRKNKEDKLFTSQQTEALLMMRVRSMARGSSGSQNHSRSKSRSKKKFKCYHCGKRGHVKKDCWHYKKTIEKAPEAKTSQGCVASTLDDEEILYSEAVISFKGDTLQKVDASVAVVSQESETTMMWHYKLGHMSERGLKILAERNLLPGLKSVSLPFCEKCVLSKQNRLKFNRSTARSKHILDLIHYDVWESRKYP
ncbi:hypothetical protein GH714_022364 [Hevea brasiliensis]|uniref:CCHC-type domain-containing protein n=1 Tax=Hevea brasiliensis TaxID=3981 RepID=A0A6A6KQL2_HEVBR|nr:hypothetical protein GH714_022364 [Hevea brasiliensis]